MCISSPGGYFWLSALPYFLIRKKAAAPYDDAAVGNYIHARLLSAEVVVHEIFGWNAKVPEHFLDSLAHGAGTAHVVFDVLRGRMVLEICLVDDLQMPSPNSPR